jgi:hypothetical protein
LSDEQRKGTTCHDRKDISNITGLYGCNDGTWKKDWRDCKDVSGYDYGGEDDDEPTKMKLAAEPDPNRFSPTGGGVHSPTENAPNPHGLKFEPFGIPLPSEEGSPFRL